VDKEDLSANQRESEAESMKPMEEELSLRDEVYAVVGAAMEVYNHLRNGFLEPVYQEAMEMELADRTIPFEPSKHLQLFYKGRLMKKRYCADILCYGQMVVELKAIDHLTSADESQLLNYLKATGLRLGILIYFGCRGKLEWKRMVMTTHGPFDPDDAAD
jgi:GxxExxY protein